MKKKLCRILSVFIVLLLCLNAPATVFAEVDFLTAEEMVTLLEKEYPEDISRRTIQTKHFQIDEAGFIAATYTDPVHYLDDENQWQDIDNTLTLVSSAEGATTASTLKSVATQYYENKANSFKVRFPEKLGGPANIQIAVDEYNLSFRMLNSNSVASAVLGRGNKTVDQRQSLLKQANATSDTQKQEELKQQAITLLSNQTSELTYSNIWANADLTYQISGQKLKESIVLSSPPTQSSFSFVFTYEDLTPVVQEFGAVHFYPVNQQDVDPIFIIEAPYMEDSGTEDSLCMDIAVAVTPTATGCIYTLTPDQEWLNDPSRVYPVTIDPTATTSTAAADIEDNGVNQSNPTTNYMTVNRMYVGSNLSGSTAQESRIYIRFPRQTKIGTTAYISKAVMHLDHYPTTSYQTADNNTLDVYEVGDYNWNTSTITWNSQSSYVFTTRYASAVTDADNTKETFNITKLVRKWYSNNGSNNGLVIKPRSKDTTKTNRTCYLSSDCDYSYEKKRPRIVITYYPEKTLDVPQIGQQYSKWCWAACTQMVASFYGYSISQKSIVYKIKELPSDATETEFNVGANSSKIVEAANYATSSSAFQYTTSVSETTLFNKIKSGHPAILIRGRYKNTNGVRTGGHATVVYGYTCSNGTRYYLIRDPWPEDDDPWPASNSGKSYQRKFSVIKEEAGTSTTVKLDGIICK